MPNRPPASDHLAIQFGESEPADPNQAMSLSPARTVAEEIGQNIPFRSPGQEAMVSLLRTADEVRRYLNGQLAPEDITLQQYNVLRILRGAGEGGLPTLEIGKRMVEHHPGVTRLIDRLIAKGFVERARGREDRRKVVCTITDKGLTVLTKLDGVIDHADAVVRGSLPDSDLRALIGQLDTLRANLQAP